MAGARTPQFGPVAAGRPQVCRRGSLDYCASAIAGLPPASRHCPEIRHDQDGRPVRRSHRPATGDTRPPGAGSLMISALPIQYFSSRGWCRALISRSAFEAKIPLDAQTANRRDCRRFDHRAGVERACLRASPVPARRPAAVRLRAHWMWAGGEHHHPLRERLPGGAPLSNHRASAKLAQALPGQLPPNRISLHRHGLLRRPTRDRPLDALLRTGLTHQRRPRRGCSRSSDS